MISLVGPLVVECRDVLERHDEPAADRYQQRVVGQLVPARGVQPLSLRVHPLRGVLAPLRSGAQRDPAERIAPDPAPRERLVHRQRPVTELVVGGQQRDLKRLPGERPQTQQSLDGGDAPSADDNPEALHAASLPRAGNH